MEVAATVALLVAIGSGVIACWSLLQTLLLSMVAVTGLVVFAAGMLLGAGVAGRGSRDRRLTVALVSGTGFGALGLLVGAVQFNGDPRYLAPAVAVALLVLVAAGVAALVSGSLNRQGSAVRWRQHRQLRGAA
jgi:peptidoglycan/LPS O-acetylase OafA/YrhL